MQEPRAKDRREEAVGGGDRNRTDVSRFCRPLPYRLATPPGPVAWSVDDTGGRSNLSMDSPAVSRAPQGGHDHRRGRRRPAGTSIERDLYNNEEGRLDEPAMRAGAGNGSRTRDFN